MWKKAEKFVFLNSYTPPDTDKTPYRLRKNGRRRSMQISL